jgi:hypothetical protein
MPVFIRDAHFERRVQPEHKERGHKSLAKTVQQLAEERLAELQLGQFLPPAPKADPAQKPEPIPA